MAVKVDIKYVAIGAVIQDVVDEAVAGLEFHSEKTEQKSVESRCIL